MPSPGTYSMSGCSLRQSTRSQGGRAILSYASSARSILKSWLLAISLARGLPAGARSRVSCVWREGQAALGVAAAAAPAIRRLRVSTAQAEGRKRLLILDLPGHRVKGRMRRTRSALSRCVKARSSIATSFILRQVGSD